MGAANRDNKCFHIPPRYCLCDFGVPSSKPPCRCAHVPSKTPSVVYVIPSLLFLRPTGCSCGEARGRLC